MNEPSVLTKVTVNAMGWYVSIMSTDHSRRRIKPFSYPGQAFYIAASMQQAQFFSAAKSPSNIALTALDLPLG